MFDYCSICFLEAEPWGISAIAQHSTVLGWAVKLVGYTAHPQNTASLLLALAQQKQAADFPYLQEFT
jgi:hypothetical protein